jgi:hypothetical protein
MAEPGSGAGVEAAETTFKPSIEKSGNIEYWKPAIPTEQTEAYRTFMYNPQTGLNRQVALAFEGRHDVPFNEHSEETNRIKQQMEIKFVKQHLIGLETDLLLAAKLSYLLNQGKGYLKEHPEVYGSVAAAGLGVLSMVTERPIPSDVLARLSAVIGGGAFGYSLGSTSREKIRNSALGVLGGGLLAEGIIQGTSGKVEPQVAGGIGFIDDAAMLGLATANVAGKGGKAALELARKRVGSLINRNREKIQNRTSKNKAPVSSFGK